MVGTDCQSGHKLKKILENYEKKQNTKKSEKV
jgi:hypothetical protein